MTEQPDRIEDLLREAMRARTAGAHPAPGLARKALRGAARGRRVQLAATAAASVAAVGAVAATGVALQHGPRGGGAASTLGGGLPSPTGSCYDTASPKAALSAVSSPGATHRSVTMSQVPSQQIQAVKLADPAPGYSLRREADSLAPTGFGPSSEYWTATFLLAQKPGVSHTLAEGAVETDPTGPEATVLVVDGHPFDLDDPATLEGVPVSGTTTVLGHDAWVTNACDQTDIFFSTGRFQVLLAGFPGGDDNAQATNIARLTAVAEKLQGLQ
jgi:hypothetical protein